MGVSAAAEYLIVGPAWVGDMVMAQSLFKLLRQKDPGAAIDVVAPPWSEPLLARMPEVREALILDVAHGQFGWALRRRLGLKLRKHAYTHALVLPRSFKSALVPWFARVPKRTGFRGEFRRLLLNDLRHRDTERLDQTVKRFVSLGVDAGAALPEVPHPGLSVDVANLARLRQTFGLAESAVALMPGAAFGPAKCWPLEYFAKLAAELGAQGVQVWILGSAGEAEAGETIRAQAGDLAVNLCGQTRLEDAVDLLSAAYAAVTNDSGLMHVAAAAGARVIAIYGSSSPRFTPPLTARADILYRGLDCSPCFQRQCPLEHLNCLREIRPDQVLRLIH